MSDLPRKQDRPNIGSSVRNGKIRYTSAKQITLFDREAEGGCPRKYAYEYLFQKKPLKTQALADGIELANTLYHYLTTGEDVLPPVLREAKRFFPAPGPDLSCEQPLGGDLARAVLLRDALLRRDEGADCEVLVRGIRLHAGVSVCDIPIEGAADWKHRRQIYVDEDGFTRKEDPSTLVALVGDLKSTSRIWQETTRGGKVLPGWAKTNSEVCQAPQMLIYGMCEILQRPETSHVRLQHVYAQKKKHAATVRGGLISAEEIRHRWRRIEGVVSDMIDTVAAVSASQSILDAPPNYDACGVFTHVGSDGESRPGCPHQEYCPRPVQEATANLLGHVKEIGMGTSLFDTPATTAAAAMPAPTNAVTPTLPPVDSQEHQRMVDMEKKKLLAESAAPPPPPVVSNGSPKPQRGEKVPVTACDPGNSYFVDCEDGQKPRLMEYRGSSKGKHFFVDTNLGWRTTLESVANVWEAMGLPVVAPPPPPSSSVAVGVSPEPPPPPVVAKRVAIGQVVPPDAPTPSLLDSAAPLPEAEVAKISDPELRTRVEAHNAAHKERTQVMEAALGTKKVSGRCPGGNQTLPLSMDVAMAKKAKCSMCGEIRRVTKMDAEAKTFLMPGHNLPGDVEVEETKPVLTAVPPSNGKNGHVIEQDDDGDAGEMMAPPPPPAAPTLSVVPPPPPPSSMAPVAQAISAEAQVAVKAEFLRVWAEVTRLVETYLKSA